MIEPRIGAMWEPPIIFEKDIPEEILKEIKEITKESEEIKMGVSRRNFEREPLHPEDLELEEGLADIRLNLMRENERLKAQLDREIHINRKMKRALEVYANIGNWASDGYGLAQQTLKEIEEME